MNLLKYLLVFVFSVSIQAASAQKKASKAQKAVIANLQAHINYLADDRLEGRRAGTPGEQLAMEYISGQFKNIGLLPKGQTSYYQSFEIPDGKQVNAGTRLFINGQELRQGQDFFPFSYSPNMNIEARPAISLLESDMPWILDLSDVLGENKGNPHFDLPEFIRSRTDEAASKGATVLLLYNSSLMADNLHFDGKDKTGIKKIPVIYISRAVADKYFSDEAASVEMKLSTDIGKKTRTGHNVLGYIDNGAATTIVLGAHFDHLGYGEDGNSMVTGSEKMIHNGADDNASGTAALIELARMLKKDRQKKSNYLFVAFSGEELGLFGSKYFVENPTIDLKQVNYMINMDMVGRLNDSTQTLTIGGAGTSPSWGEILFSSPAEFKIKIDSSGTGPSDHTSFYRKDIPVLFFFTGLHTDYHKPGDDADKINYEGEYDIISYINNVIAKSNKVKGRLAFSKTRETQTATSARFSVSLGIMPDYTFTGEGVRADGISQGRAAEKAGMKTGDVIIQLGDYPVHSMESYMQALSKFKKGDITRVKFKRGSETIEAGVQF